MWDLKNGGCALDVFANGLAVLDVPNLSFNSYTFAENDGLPSWFVVGYVVCTWPSYWLCWGDGERDGYHLAWFLFQNTNMFFWCCCGVFGFAGNGTCWVAWFSICGFRLATCSKVGSFITGASFYTSSWDYYGFGMVWDAKTSRLEVHLASTSSFWSSQVFSLLSPLNPM